MKKLFSVFLVTVLCFSLCSCGKDYDRAMELLELVEKHDLFAAHQLLNEMAEEGDTLWVPEYCVTDSYNPEDSWGYDDSCGDIYGDSCGSIGSGSDFWNGDSAYESSGSNGSDETYNEPIVEEPKEIPVEGIKISDTEINMEYGDTAALSAFVYPENTTEYVGDIKFESSDTAVVYVNTWDGTIETRGTGTATITASWDDHTATCVVNVGNATISTVEEFVALKDIPKNVVYELVADLDMTGVEAPEYSEQLHISGTLEGNGHKIYNLGYGPLIGHVDSTGVLRNLIVECDITQKSQEQGKKIQMGVVAGGCYGLIERCISRGTVHMEVDYAYVSGIVSSLGPNGKIYQCMNETNVIFGGTVINPLGIEMATETAVMTGIVYNDTAGIISQCVNLGSATFLNNNGGTFSGIANEPSYVEDCYNLGTFTGGYGAGIAAANFGTLKNCINYALVDNAFASLSGGYIIDCYYPKEKCVNGAYASSTLGEEGRKTQERFYGLSDSELIEQESYPALDFENVWVMGPDGYPILKWQTQ